MFYARVLSPTGLALGLLLLALMLGCGKTAQPEARVLWIGLDGIEWEVLKPLLERGELPHLEGLIERGVVGYLQTFEPSFSPVLWTTMATGKYPPEHKIVGFLDPDTQGPFTSNARKGKALWNIASDYGLRCNVTGYWITWPAEAINGIMISQVTTREQYDDIWKGMLYENVKDSTYPPEFIDEIWPVVEPFQTRTFIDEEILPRIFDFPKDLNPSSKVVKLISDSNWSLAGDFVYSEAGKYLLEHHPGDLDIVYLGGTDVLAHRFWAFREPDFYEYKIQDRYIEAFGSAIDNYYKVADRMVGDLLARVPENTRVIVCSDHGMGPKFPDGKDGDRRTILSAHHLDAPAGILIAAGDGIKKGPGLKAVLESGTLDNIGNVLDITPTLLYLMDIPVGRDMKGGRVMKSVVDPHLLDARPVEYVDTHDVDFRPPTSSRRSIAGEKAFIKNFSGLGYIDGGKSDASEFKMGPKK
jgi:predicted AlkP superfamily phosphohydrolase/phosphomutase